MATTPPIMRTDSLQMLYLCYQPTNQKETIAFNTEIFSPILYKCFL